MTGSTPPNQNSVYYTAQCIRRLYAAQQLRGSAGAWCASYTIALPEDHHVPWDEFRVAFRGYHVSAGTMHRKLAEFLDL
jgi:hypothetical protein